MRILPFVCLLPLLATACSSSDDATAATSPPASSAGGQSAGGTSGDGGASGHAQAAGMSGSSGQSAGGHASGATGVGGASPAGGNHAGGADGGSGGAVIGGGGSAGAPVGGSGGEASGGSGGANAGGSGGAAAGAGGSGGVAGAGGGSFVTAPHAPLPKLMPHGKIVLPSPEIVTVTFPGYKYKKDVATFGDAVASTSWMAEVGGSYGVGAAKNLGAFELPDAAQPKMTDADAQTLLLAHTKDLLLPAITANTIYLLYLPSTTVLQDTTDPSAISTSCTDFWGYHGAASSGNDTLVYAIITDCPADGELITDITSTSAHEIAEAATDPTDGWWFEGKDSDPWAWIDDGTEAADLCEWFPNITIGGSDFQRVWSNDAIAKGGDPCVPLPAGDVYRNVSPDVLQMPVVMPGQSATFTLTGWSTAEVPDWTIETQADSLTWSVGFEPTAKLSSTTMNNGKTVTLTLTVPVGTPSGSVGVVKVASDHAGAQFWPVGVQTP